MSFFRGRARRATLDQDVGPLCWNRLPARCLENPTLAAPGTLFRSTAKAPSGLATGFAFAPCGGTLCPGEVTTPVRRVLLELSEIRHVLVHRRGKADAKLVKDRCPWLPFKIGEEV